ncbi:hypothetical protein V8E51_010501 [Hyaloscypha variabilis]
MLTVYDDEQQHGYLYYVFPGLNIRRIQKKGTQLNLTKFVIMKFALFLTILTVAATLASASPFPDRAKYAKALNVIEPRGDDKDSEPKYQRF